MAIIPALGRQSQVDLCEFEAILGYRWFDYYVVRGLFLDPAYLVFCKLLESSEGLYHHLFLKIYLFIMYTEEGVPGGQGKRPLSSPLGWTGCSQLVQSEPMTSVVVRVTGAGFLGKEAGKGGCLVPGAPMAGGGAHSVPLGAYLFLVSVGFQRSSVPSQDGPCLLSHTATEIEFPSTADPSARGNMVSSKPTMSLRAVGFPEDFSSVTHKGSSVSTQKPVVNFV
ncbi:hypothetical protein STEG23_014161 [Scotinomys teguina]